MSVTHEEDRRAGSGLAGDRLDSIVARLIPQEGAPGLASGLRGWVGPLAVTALAALIRLPNLARPDALSFDETYYAKDSLGILRFGSEREVVDKANDIILAKDAPWDQLDIFKDSPAFVVHPPVGKWTIALGEYFFGVTPFGWRIAVCVLGIISVLMFARIVRRLTRSDLMGTMAGFLMAIDGMHIVMSRTGLLDLTLMFWVLAGFGCMLIDRDRTRARAARLAVAAAESGTWDSLVRGAGPGFGLRVWRIAAGLCLGMAVATKWSALWYIAAFGLISVFWDSGTRRVLGIRNPFTSSLLRDALPGFVSIVFVGLAVYLASWVGWFNDPGGWGRNWAADHPNPIIPDALWSLMNYHQQAWNFHVNLSTPHSYQSTPWAWLFQARPISFFYEGYDQGSHGCAVEKCSAEVLALGNPIIWWAGTLAILHQAWRAIGHRDWRAAAVVVAFLAGWAPWVMFGARTIFAFYAIVYLPFLIAAVTMSAGAILGPAENSSRRRWGAAAVGLFLLACLVSSWWFMPIWTGETIPYDSWLNRMWFPTWI